MDKHDLYSRLNKVKIEKMWGLCAGAFVYEGCGILLKDGRPCALGKHKRRVRRLDSQSPLGPHSRGRGEHVCCADGTGTYMYCFVVEVGGIVMQVNEAIGMQLMGISGQSFKNSCTNDEKTQRICKQVMSAWWTITYVRKDCGDDLPRALCFERSPCTESEGTSVANEAPIQSDTKEGKLCSDMGSARDSDEEEISDPTKDHRSLSASFRRFRGAISDPSGDIVSSLKSFRISE